MKLPVYHEALGAYQKNHHEFVIEPLQGGLINNSYKVTSRINKSSFLLQRINHRVFTEPKNVQHNYELLWNYIQSTKQEFYIPEPKYFPESQLIYCDSKNNYWRVFEFIENARTLSIAENAEQAEATAATFAAFSAAFAGFDTRLLKETIPDFHNLSFRYRQFTDALDTRQYERRQKAGPLIEQLIQRIRYVNFYEIINGSDAFPKRVMHHDAKIANLLFSSATGKVICPVDFDTVMPGYFFSDLGDMIRSMACSLDETSTDFDNISIRKNFYEAIMRGYLSVMENKLTNAEKEYIHYAGIMLIYMQALRYMADYLNGDMYYHIAYTEQNFDRAKNQLTLLKRLEAFLMKEYTFKI